MSRIGPYGFGALVVATAAAFFITQHLKTTTPLIATPRVDPAAINPQGGPCRFGQHRVSLFSFYLLHSADHVAVSVVDPAGHVVRTLARDRAMNVQVRHPDGDFSWDGRTDRGTLAPDGPYMIRVDLLRQDRRVILASGAAPLTITVLTAAPQPRVLAVSPVSVPVGGSPVEVSYAIAGARPDDVASADIFRRAGDGMLHLVRRFRVAPRATSVAWNLKIAGRPAPPGRYLIGMDALDPACNTGRFPSRIPPPPGQASGAYVTIHP